MCQAIWFRIETRCALVVVCSYACRAGWASHRPSRRGSAASTLSSIECSSRNARCTVESLQRFGGKVAKQRRSRPQGPARGSPVGASARIWRGGRGDSLCDDAAETRRRTARRAAPRRTRFREENHGKDASATAARGSERPISASVKKVSGRFRAARKYFSPCVYRGLVKIRDNLSQKIWDKPGCNRLVLFATAARS